ncbi:MFS transporter [Caldichromatium japonicum]|uniref:MFS transporter n=2 Tax=Caldichromatium japonicum TaxID=2699430 RepID=A0A6G7VGR4_9GAMM|nr:MFS transporter [Caldichromatium japonicum]
MLPAERRAVIGLAAIFSTRMLGLFMVLPVLAVYAYELPGATPFLVGLAVGAYGLTQAIFQIPLGFLSDRVGRKPVIYGGLGLFVLGGAVAALAIDVYWVILGRTLQGSGAIAAAIIALTVDLTREEVRTKGMAAIGISVAFSFALALVIGPMLSGWLGMQGLFWLTALLGLTGILILATLVPNPKFSTTHREAEPAPDQLSGVIGDPILRRLDLAVFLLHLIMVSLFVVLPLSLREAGLDTGAHWQVYLPAVLIAIPAMLPFILLAERRGQTREVLVGSVAALLLAMLGFYSFNHSPWLMGLMLAVMFTVFNLLEAILPALVSKAAAAGAKGTAMGVFSTAQFIGAFCGGMLGGLAHEHFGANAVYLVGAGIALVWLGLATTMPLPENLLRHVLVLDAVTLQDAADLQQRLLSIPGVREAVVAQDEGVAYLKVDSRLIDWATLQAFAATRS